LTRTEYYTEEKRTLDVEAFEQLEGGQENITECFISEPAGGGVNSRREIHIC
jgi:hypothetical protein